MNCMIVCVPIIVCIVGSRAFRAPIWPLLCMPLLHMKGKLILSFGDKVTDMILRVQFLSLGFSCESLDITFFESFLWGIFVD